MTTPEAIIGAFDEILDYVFGKSRGRDYPSKSDAEWAAAWIKNGLTVPIASAVFFNRMSIMHERWLRQRDQNDKTNIPRNIGVFDENIVAALNRVRAGGEPISAWEQSESQWRARINGWYRGPLWREDLWGPPPEQPGCRAPARIVAELKPKRKKDSRR